MIIEQEVLPELKPGEWAPHRKQEQFIALPFEIFEALYGGSAFSGKSELLVLLPLIYKFHLHRKFKGIILRRTFPELEKEIINRSHEYYSKAGGKYNMTKKTWFFPSGAQLQFGHAENEEDIRKYDGVEYNFVGFDEVTHFTEFQYLYLAVSRCRSSSPDLPAIVRSTSNPGNIGHVWVRKRFVDPNPEGGKIIRQNGSEHLRFFLKALPQDNPYGMKNDPGYISRMELLPEAEKRAKLYGDWYTFSGQVFDNFRIEPLSDEPENARHVVEPFEIPDYWPKVNMTDWGFTANTASLWGAISPQSRVYIYREYLVCQEPVSTWGTEIGDFNRKDKNLRVVGMDTNAWDQRGEDETIAESFVKYSKLSSLNLSLQKASKARISGKILIQEFLRWKQKPKAKMTEAYDSRWASYLLARKGLAAYKEYQKRFDDEPDEDNLPKLQIFSTCSNLIRTIPICTYDKNNPEDAAEFDGDDVYDCLRYLLKAIVKYLDEAKEEFARFKKLDDLNKRLENSQDFTSYHIARQLAEARTQSFGVSRYHKGPRGKVQTLSEIIRTGAVESGPSFS